MPVKRSIPAPLLVRLPVVAADVPEIVKVAVASDTEIVLDVEAVSVKLRSVELPEPVHCSVPPPSTRFEAVVAEAPILLFELPLAIVPMLSVPALIVVTPV